MAVSILRRLYHYYAEAGHPLLPITRLLRSPLRWYYHRSPLLRHDARRYFKPHLLHLLHRVFVVEHPQDFRIYRNQIKFRSYGSLMSLQGYYVGEIEYHLMQYVVSQIRPNMIMFDVGAHHGAYTLVVAYELRKRGWTGEIHSFEPDKNNFALLEYNVKQNNLQDYVILHNAAVADTEGDQELITFSDENSGNTLVANKGIAVPEDIESYDGVRRQTVRVETLDSLLHRVDAVHLIKMDVQGSEPLVITGARQLLCRDKPTLVVEVMPNLPTGAAITAALKELGYTLYSVDKRGKLCSLFSSSAFVSWDVVARSE
jgi:FkbM family methyltransferase